MKRSLLALLLLAVTVIPSAAQSVPQLPFESVPDFLKLPAGLHLGEVPGVAVNSKGHVFVFTRSNSAGGPAYAPAAAQLLEFGPNGAFIREIGKGLYAWSFAHSVRVDRNDHIWAIDKGSDMVVRFNPAGQVVMVFGRRRESADPETKPWEEVEPPLAPVDGLFRQPTDVAWDSSGNIYISDGYVNSRVAKIDKNGEWVTSWGSFGTGPGEFDNPHNIAVDARGQVYVADRGNARIQVFDGDGRFLRQFKIEVPLPKGARLPIGNTPDTPATTGTNAPGSPFVVCITPGPTQYLFSADNWGRIFKMDLDGRLLGVLGRSGKLLGQFGQIHGMACPADNEIYVAEILNWRVQKLKLGK